MRRQFHFLLASVFAVLSFNIVATPPQIWSQPPSDGRVCVAMLNNHSSKSLFVERLTERLVRDLTESKIKAVAMESSTTSDRALHPTVENGEELKGKECDYLVLTQISEPKDRPTEPHSPEISIGGKVPSVDASDPLGGASGPQYRDNLEVNFAVFRPGTLKAMLDARILAQPSGNVSDSLMQAMDRVANRISRELKKK